MPKVLKRGSIKDPDRMFSDLAQDIGKYYAEIGRNLGLKQSRLDNELESDRFLFAPPSEKAMNMLTMWKQSVTEESFTYSALAAALEKNDLLRECADKYCYIGLPSHYDTKLAARTAEPSTQGLKGVIVCAETHVTVTNDARSFTWEGYGLKLDIKEKSLPKGTEKITIYIKASITGDYDIQEGYERVSPVFWFRCDPMCKLEKEVTLEIQHCVMLECACDLTFARADCSQEKLPYTFELLKSGKFSNLRPYGIIELNGFSLFTLLLKLIINENPIWYFAQLFYSKRGTQEIHLAITKNSESYTTVLYERYKMMDLGPNKSFQFRDNTITVILQECEDGWKLYSDNPSKITKQEVDGCHVSPSYQLTAIPEDKTRPLQRKLSLHGAKPVGDDAEPSSELYLIIRKPATEQKDSPQPHSAEGSKRAAQPEEMIHELGETPKEPTLKELMKRLDGCVAKWRPIGVQLEFVKGDLDDIKQIYHTDNWDCLAELMGRWLDRGDASWSNLVEALETCRVNKNIIDSIKNDYCLKCRQ